MRRTRVDRWSLLGALVVLSAREPEDHKRTKEAGREQYPSHSWKKLMKLVDLGEPTSVLDHVYSGCTQRQCKSNKNNIDVENNVR